jgi:hypothetical protein
VRPPGLHRQEIFLPGKPTVPLHVRCAKPLADGGSKKTAGGAANEHIYLATYMLPQLIFLSNPTSQSLKSFECVCKLNETAGIAFEL